MSNVALMAARARGMAGLGELSGWFDEWGKEVIGQGFDFGKTFIQSKYAKDAAKYQTPGAGLVPNYTQEQLLALQAAAARANAGDEYGSGGISSAGIRIGGTLISWPTLALGVGVLMLVQSKPFSRGGGGRRSY